MAKPAGPACNLACGYCFYRERGLDPGPGMSDEVLEAFVRGMFRAHGGAPVVRFDWQGGEPTLLGVEFFERAVALQKRYRPPPVRVENAFQTNGVLIDEDWARLFAKYGFLVGVSLDGPRELHDALRPTRGGAPTFDRVVRAIELLRGHDVAVNVLTVVGRHNAGHPREVYRLLREQSPFLQLIPCVERVVHDGPDDGRPLAGPPERDPLGVLAPWAVTSEDWGDFLCGVFDEWVAADVGRVFVQLFDAALGLTAGFPGGLCVLEATCGTGLALEADGSLYPCDHYVYPELRVGSLPESSLALLARGPAMQAFGRAKRDGLPAECRECEELRRCGGGCPKHRFDVTVGGVPGKDVLCAGWQRFLAHAGPDFDAMAALIHEGQPPARVMERRKRADH